MSTRDMQGNIFISLSGDSPSRDGNWKKRNNGNEKLINFVTLVFFGEKEKKNFWHRALFLCVCVCERAPAWRHYHNYCFSFSLNAPPWGNWKIVLGFRWGRNFWHIWLTFSFVSNGSSFLLVHILHFSCALNERALDDLIQLRSVLR